MNNEKKSLEETIDWARKFLQAGNYVEALRLTRVYQKLAPNGWPKSNNAAGLLIDIGCDTNNTKLLKEGTKLAMVAREEAPPEYRGMAEYNAGNGFLGLGKRERGASPGTKPALSKAVSLLSSSVEQIFTPEARINLAGALMDQGRWIEAIDQLCDVLSETDAHPEAQARLAGAYVMAFRYSQAHHGLLQSAIHLYRDAADASNDAHFVQSCKEHLAYIENLIGLEWFDKLANIETPRRERRTSFQKWIWESRLALNTCPHCAHQVPDAYDTSVIGGFLEGGDRRPSIGTIKEVLNTLHRTYSSARWCLAQGTGIVKVSQSEQVLGYTSDVEGKHDLSTGLIIVAYGQFYSVLDKVAAALNSLFHLGHKDRTVDFNTVWRARNARTGFPKERGKIHTHLARLSNPGMAALYRLAEALETGGGMYEDLRKLRNKMEHRIVVPKNESSHHNYYHEVDQQVLASNTQTIGRLSKAAIIYFGGAMYDSERRRLKMASMRGDVITNERGIGVYRRRG